MNEDVGRAVLRLAQEVVELRERVRSKPDLRQGKVITTPSGTPKTCTVTIDEGSYQNVILCTAQTIANNDMVWVLVLAGGTRMIIGKPQ